MSDTPRTDEFCEALPEGSNWCGAYVAAVILARKLERELADAQRAVNVLAAERDKRIIAGWPTAIERQSGVSS